jgi:flagellar hook-associated protein 3 FlgL
MSISTTLLFSRAVSLMSQQQSDLASLQEKVATGKELVRPSDSPDLAVNISRIKASIDQMDAYKNSLNAVNDRLTIEESYIEGSKDVLIKMKQLTLQGSNGTMTGRDREVIALEIDELIDEMKNLANGTDANGNFLFGGSRVATMPYSEDDNGVIRYQGDNFRPNIDYTANRRSPIGRNGLDVFKPVLSGESTAPVPGVYDVTLGGTLEPKDTYTLIIDGESFSYEVRPGDDNDQVLGRLAYAVNESNRLGETHNLEAAVVDGKLQITAIDGVARQISVGSTNGGASTDDLLFTVATDEATSVAVASLSGTMERGDSIKLTIGVRSITYNISGDEGGLTPTTPAAVIQAIKDTAESSGLFSESVTFELDPNDPSQLLINPTRDNVGQIQIESIERTDINDQAIQVTLSQEPTPALPERIEFFEALQGVAIMLRNGTQDQLQGKLDHLDQMLDIVTLSLADIGAEMNSIDDEISINEDLKLQLEATLAGQEDLDYATAITELQAKMMSLEAAQASFAKISQLSVFDYIR